MNFLKRYIKIPEILTKKLSKFKFIWMLLFAIICFTNLLPAANDLGDPKKVNAIDILELVGALAYIVLLIGSYFVALPEFVKRIPKGIEKKETKKPKLLKAWNGIIFFIGTLLIGLFLMAEIDNFVMHFFPYMQQVLDKEQEKLSLLPSIGMGLFATNEEIWRYSFITVFLIVTKMIFTQRWNNLKFQWIAMGIAILVSSCLFGLFHIGNYSTGAFPTFLDTCLAGIVLALVTVLTGRILFAMLIHCVFDAIAFMNLDEKITNFGFWLTYGILALLLLFTILLNKKKKNV